ncbi:MAG: chemotaxis protein CheD [Anaeromyxobacter sp.]|nr:chemotaxis protein CheD [Anaeromyxobacter sp.]MBL0276189.1 chemotaxis protein CheD [Anaeromyxobacter sp.]
MRLITVSIGGLEVTADRDATLITHGLGSCIAVMTYDPLNKVAGMLHFQLPTSTLSPERAQGSPGTFADTGIPMLFERMYALGSKKASILVKVAGGGNFHGDNGTFDIGKRNYTMMRKIFWKAQVLIGAEDCGGNRSRTARLFVDTGQITIQSGSEVSQL